jgi:hypothetical protein
MIDIKERLSRVFGDYARTITINMKNINGYTGELLFNFSTNPELDRYNEALKQEDAEFHRYFNHPIFGRMTDKQRRKMYYDYNGGEDENEESSDEELNEGDYELLEQVEVFDVPVPDKDTTLEDLKGIARHYRIPLKKKKGEKKDRKTLYKEILKKQEKELSYDNVEVIEITDDEDEDSEQEILEILEDFSDDSSEEDSEAVSSDDESSDDESSDESIIVHGMGEIDDIVGNMKDINDLSDIDTTGIEVEIVSSKKKKRKNPTPKKKASPKKNASPKKKPTPKKKTRSNSKKSSRNKESSTKKSNKKRYIEEPKMSMTKNKLQEIASSLNIGLNKSGKSKTKPMLIKEIKSSLSKV